MFGMKRPSVAVVDYGAANRTSVLLALDRAGAQASLVCDAPSLEAANAIVLPGVAHAGYILGEIDRLGLREVLLASISRGKPVLGICAGFQILFERSDEAPKERGFGIFPGAVEALLGKKRQHVGWSRIRNERDDDIVRGGWMYFTHGFARIGSDASCVATSPFGDGRFTAAARIGNTLGVQFHPERSGEPGTELLRAFVRLGETKRAG
jgi:imidazole glycerol phosphate synthase glutamine amidotransferase subunit